MPVGYPIRNVLGIITHGSAVLAGGRLPEQLSEILAEQALKERIATIYGFPDGINAATFEFFKTPASDAPHLIEGKGPDVILNISLAVEHRQAVGLLQIRSQLGVGFRSGDADAALQPGLFKYGLFYIPAELYQLFVRLRLLPGNIHEVFVHTVGFHVR